MQTTVGSRGDGTLDRGHDPRLDPGFTGPSVEKLASKRSRWWVDHHLAHLGLSKAGSNGVVEIDDQHLYLPSTK